MRARAAITIGYPREEVVQRWSSAENRPEWAGDATAAVTFVEAPGDRGTEIHVDLDQEARGGTLGEIIGKLTGNDPLAQIKDDLRRFKQRMETGEIARSDATPEGESAGRKLKQRPAQPLAESELEAVQR
jgi:uncharacterized membrane protein